MSKMSKSGKSPTYENGVRDRWKRIQADTEKYKDVEMSNQSMSVQNILVQALSLLKVRKRTKKILKSSIIEV